MGVTRSPRKAENRSRDITEKHSESQLSAVPPLSVSLACAHAAATTEVAYTVCQNGSQ